MIQTGLSRGVAFTAARGKRSELQFKMTIRGIDTDNVMAAEIIKPRPLVATGREQRRGESFMELHDSVPGNVNLGGKRGEISDAKFSVFYRPDSL
ncbi:hypothetical protein BV898_15763 [Hypsibius exemplaris]|uniref:Uncharacterized protein n=1 Tax=Hypsibius exemplaris TaxID=2072580 RepID=A0A9X6NEJ0_HYPEX|nr:hypothetical protein BV898_15763 [Hypsibius exemplaris]